MRVDANHAAIKSAAGLHVVSGDYMFSDSQLAHIFKQERYDKATGIWYIDYKEAICRWYICKRKMYRAASQFRSKNSCTWRHGDKGGD